MFGINLSGGIKLDDQSSRSSNFKAKILRWLKEDDWPGSGGSTWQRREYAEDTLANEGHEALLSLSDYFR